MPFDARRPDGDGLRVPRRPWRAAALLAALVLAGCASLPVPEPGAAPAVPAAFREAGPTGAATAAAPADGRWWQAFGDPVLAALVERAGRENNAIHGAAARLAQARALVRQAGADRAPQVGAGAGAGRATGPDGRPLTTLHAGIGLGYEVDLFRRLARAGEAASLDAQAREALLRDTRRLVQADTAQSYLALRALDEERRLVRDTVEAYRETLDLIERRFRAGDVAELDVARVRAQVAATEAESLGLDRRRAELEHALALLVGAAASDFALEPAAWSPTLPQIPPGLPSELLTRRPDVAAARHAVDAARERVGIARSAWFPQLHLTADGGVASPELGDLLRWSARQWGVGALLSLPIFDGGRREAQLAGANAQLEAEMATWREQVLAAFRDVEDQLSALRLLARQGEAQDRAIEAAARATRLSAARYRNGLVSQLDLLDAQRNELANRRQALQVRAAQAQATVGLVRALGGGWSDAAAPA